MSKVDTIFKELLKFVPQLDLKLVVGPRSQFPKNRDYAACSPIGVIMIAPRMEQASNDRITAVLMHEIGHALDFEYSHKDLEEACGALPKTPERKADAIAEAIFGVKMYYDIDLVQSLRSGLRPRPTHLGL